MGVKRQAGERIIGVQGYEDCHCNWPGGILKSEDAAPELGPGGEESIKVQKPQQRSHLLLRSRPVRQWGLEHGRGDSAWTGGEDRQRTQPGGCPVVQL